MINPIPTFIVLNSTLGTKSSIHKPSPPHLSTVAGMYCEWSFTQNKATLEASVELSKLAISFGNAI